MGFLTLFTRLQEEVIFELGPSKSHLGFNVFFYPTGSGTATGYEKWSIFHLLDEVDSSNFEKSFCGSVKFSQRLHDPDDLRQRKALLEQK